MVDTTLMKDATYMLNEAERHLTRTVYAETSDVIEDWPAELAAMAVAFCRIHRVNCIGFVDLWKKTRLDVYDETNPRRPT